MPTESTKPSSMHANHLNTIASSLIEPYELASLNARYFCELFLISVSPKSGLISLWLFKIGFIGSGLRLNRLSFSALVELKLWVSSLDPMKVSHTINLNAIFSLSSNMLWAFWKQGLSSLQPRGLFATKQKFSQGLWAQDRARVLPQE